MKKKALIIANTASMILLFNKINIDVLEDAGYEVHVACNFKTGNTTSKEVVEKNKLAWDKEGIKEIQLSVKRTPWALSNIIAFMKIRRLLKKEQYDIVHCHTPIVSALTKLATVGIKKTRVVHTVHGYHFYKNSPVSKWLIYYPIEKLLGPLTDMIITINTEDLALAREHINAKNVEYIQGIGVDTKKFSDVEVDKDYLKDELGLSKDSIILLSIGELITRKNHLTVMKAMRECNMKNVHYVIAGIGEIRDELENTAADMQLGDRVHFLGFRTDVPKLLKSSDIFCFPSFREGLPVALMESMAAGLPVVVSNIRGTRDLIDSEGGFYAEPTDYVKMAEHIKVLIKDEALRKRMGEYNREKVKFYDKAKVREKLESLLKKLEG